MNKKFFVLFFVLVLSFQLILAAQIDVKQEVLKGENLIVKVSGNFVDPPALEDISFKRRHMPTSFGFYDLFELENEYYIYATVPTSKIADNYSIIISGTEYYVGANTASDDIVGEFKILEEEVSFQVSPGILITEENYTVELFNLEPSKITIEYEKEAPRTGVGESSFWDDLFGEEIQEIQGSSKTISLLSGEEKELILEPESQLGFQEVEFSYENETYSVLVYVEELKVNETTNETVNETQEEVEEEIVVEEEDETIEEGEEEIIVEDEESSLWDKILGRDNVVEEGEEDLIFDEELTQDLETCDEMGYNVCSENEECEGDTEYGQDAICCLGECNLVTKSSSGKTVGWVIIIAVAFFVTWFLKKKYQKTKTSPETLIKNK